MQRARLQGPYDDQLYWQRVHRNLGWFADEDDEQRRRQETLRDTVVGVAGCGGSGGAVAVRLARMGVRKLKVADPELFEVSNIHRQTGASMDTVGRSKAAVVADLAFALSRDIEIDVYSEGITAANAADFVDGCTVVMDQLEFFQIANRYALHRAFRAAPDCRFMFNVPVVGNRVFLFTYTKESMPIEEVYGLPEDTAITPEVTRRLIERICPELPTFPSAQTLDHWFLDKGTMPILGGMPPVAEGLICSRLLAEIVDLPGRTRLPAQPGYAMFDVLNWTAKIVQRAAWA
nr:ThiF family adenylyltransferase [Kibdelosporangium sp. MJ126-NF4]CEL14207.1 Molybdopterin biosynthesis protein MoeB [Kibdelosporangium sp. MJ126-NF4]CTQ88575.1 Molybdopterin biosynthesis protein MoeB [Kibdelosporangium sp. MJ126-NF4]